MKIVRLNDAAMTSAAPANNCGQIPFSLIFALTNQLGAHIFERTRKSRAPGHAMKEQKAISNPRKLAEEGGPTKGWRSAYRRSNDPSILAWEEFKPSDLDEILARALDGSISREQAEQEAARIGAAPLECVPDPSEFDPLNEAFWTPLMALAWVVWRSADQVRVFWPAYQNKCRRWKTMRLPPDPALDLNHPRIGHVLIDGVEPSITAMKLLARESETADFARHQKALWDALENGDLTGTGSPDWSSPRVEIPKLSWRDLEFDGATALQSRRTSERYEDVGLRRKDILDIWNAKKSTTPTAKDETAAKKALACKLKDNPDMGRDDAETWCKEAGYEIGDRGYLNRVWPGARELAGLPTKARPGRKSKKLKREIEAPI